MPLVVSQDDVGSNPTPLTIFTESAIFTATVKMADSVKVPGLGFEPRSTRV